MFMDVKKCFFVLIICCYGSVNCFNQEELTKQITNTILNLLTPGYDNEQRSRGNSAVDPYMLEGTINETIEGLRDSIPDPINLFDELELDILNGSLKLQQIGLSGLKGFQVSALKFSLIGTRLELTLVLPSIGISVGHYDLRVFLLQFLPIYGAGNLSVSLEDFEIKINTSLVIDLADLLGSLHLNDFTIELDLRATKFQISGLFLDDIISEIASGLITPLVDSLVLPYFKDNKEGISIMLSKALLNSINDILDMMRAGTVGTDTKNYKQFNNY